MYGSDACAVKVESGDFAGVVDRSATSSRVIEERGRGVHRIERAFRLAVTGDADFSE
jgi:hypothetical protein